MENGELSFESVTLAYFSGTGGTKMVADLFYDQLMKFNLPVKRINIGKADYYEPSPSDLFMIFSPVYAFRLSSIVEKWVAKLPATTQTMVALFSVSGGGEMSPNTACRSYCKKILAKKGYNLIYEKMLIMPSNFAIQMEEQMNLDLLTVLPQKTEQILTELLSGKKNIIKPLLKDRFFKCLGLAEHMGAKVFGASIHASSACNQCGLCIRNCPRKNIHFKNKLPKFGFRCIWCLKCIYSCPSNALSPAFGKFAVFENGYNIHKLKEKATQNPSEVTYRTERNILWQGAIDYLNESVTK